MRRKLERPSKRVNVALFDDQCRRMEELFPGVSRAEIVRKFVDKMLRLIETKVAAVEDMHD